MREMIKYPNYYETNEMCILKTNLLNETYIYPSKQNFNILVRV